MKPSIVIPVYNERHTIKELIRRVQEVDVGLNKEIIIVDNGSGSSFSINLPMLSPSITDLEMFDPPFLLLKII